MSLPTTTGWGRWLSRRTCLLLGALGLCGFAAVCTRARTAPAPAAAAARRSVQRAAPSAERTVTQLAPASVAPRRDAQALPRVAPQVTEETPRHPHPISAAHRRIFEENNRIAALNGALDRGDVAEIRRLNAEYRRLYPEDEQVLQEGYDLIADCLEQPSEHTLRAAERFWVEQRASTLRRHVRRHCMSALAP